MASPISDAPLLPDDHTSLPVAAPSAIINLITSFSSGEKLLNTICDRYFSSPYKPYTDSPELPLCDFCFGNPQDPPSPVFLETLQQSLLPKTNDYFAYRINSAEPCQYLANSCKERYAFEELSPDDVFLTTGNFSNLSLALQLLVDPHENVVYMEPGWFFYRRLIQHARGKPICVHMPLGSPQKHKGTDEDQDFDDMEVFLDAIDHNTKVIILNSPHNPTGKVYSQAWLETFSSRLMDINRNRKVPVYVLSDEAYSDYVFDEHKHVSITSIYPYSLLAYTYNKMTLAPSQRIGFMLLSPLMPRRESLREGLFNLQMINSWCFPNAIMMESIPSLEVMRDNFEFKSVISKRRDQLTQILEEIGYEILFQPKGSFYMLVKTPIEDDERFCERLWENNILILPGQTFQRPGCFRLSLTATDDMVKRSVTGFRNVFNQF